MNGVNSLKMYKILILLLAMLSWHASASTQDEINHLLNFVSSTDCKYERNGDLHNGLEAVAHIKKKYEYYAEDIKTAEDFIKYSATKSKMSGKYYKIHCKDMAAVKSQEWLLEELKAYRKK